MSRATWPTKRISGVESCIAMWMPGEALVAPGPARHEADAGAAGELAVGLRHHRRAALLAADGDVDRGVVQRVEHGEVALARHAEEVIDAVDDELVDEDLAAGPGVGGHCPVLLIVRSGIVCRRSAGLSPSFVPERAESRARPAKKRPIRPAIRDQAFRGRSVRRRWRILRSSTPDHDAGRTVRPNPDGPFWPQSGRKGAESRDLLPERRPLRPEIPNRAFRSPSGAASIGCPER